MSRGKIHLYYGYGKGKTTAAMGLCLRAAGAGKRVLIFQFLKDNSSNERKFLERFPGVTCLLGPEQEKFTWELSEDERQEKTDFYQQILKRIRGMEADYDVILLDELLDTVSFGILEEEYLLDYMRTKQEHTELIITGHKEHERVIQEADYVTEMKKIKHPFDGGLASREGIEY